jgi:PKD repeat protein
VVVAATLLLGLVLACSLLNQLPIAQIVASAISGTSPLTVSFDGTDSVDPDGIITSYVWDFGDGSAVVAAPQVTHTYTTTETVDVFVATLTVTDSGNATSQAFQTIEVYANPDAPVGEGVPTARFTLDTFIGVAPLTVNFDASESTSGGGMIAAYNWNFGDDGTATGIKATHGFIPDPDETTTYTVTLFVWSTNGEVDTEQHDVFVIVPDNEAGDDAPEAEVTISDPNVIYESDNPTTVPTLIEVAFDPRGSYSAAGHGIEFYAWDFGDGETQVETSDLEITHIYELSAPSRTFVAKLTVFDDQGYEDTEVINVTLEQPD